MTDENTAEKRSFALIPPDNCTQRCSTERLFSVYCIFFIQNSDVTAVRVITISSDRQVYVYVRVQQSRDRIQGY